MLRTHRRLIKLVIAGVMICGVGMGITVATVTNRPGFCNSCHEMSPYFTSWSNSEHQKVSCLDCHLEPGWKGYVKGKVAASRYVIKHFTDANSIELSGEVKEGSCSRAGCHTFPETSKVDHKMIAEMESNCTACHAAIHAEK